jgi:integrase
MQKRKLLGGASYPAKLAERWGKFPNVRGPDTMTTKTKVKGKAPDLAALLTSWQLDLDAQNKSPKTIKHYVEGSRMFIRWCETNGVTPELTKLNIQTWMAELLANGAQPGTARARYAALRRFSAWLHKQGELPADIFKDMTPPKLDVKITNPLTDAELHDLIKVCDGNTFRDRRDQAIIRLMAETGMRAGECVALTTQDVDLIHGKAIVRRGKGAKGREVPFGKQTAAALDRYLRARREHTLADRPALWLGGRKDTTFGYTALYRAIAYRARLAGITDCHPHRFRHTYATRWLRAGGTEGGLMSVAGWSRREMIDRYTKATATQRAADEAKKLDLGNF